MLEALAWRWDVIRRHAFLAVGFRNGAQLLRSYQRMAPCDHATTFGGKKIIHPARPGLAQTILEVWHDQVYTGGFYRPMSGDVVIDAGANVGLFSLWLAARCKKCRVVAFEPFAENFRCLEVNLAAARLTNVMAVQAGLGRASGFGRICDGGMRSLDHRLIEGESVAGGDQIRVFAFADVFNLCQAERVALFKVDIEGSERDLFEGATSDDIARVDRFAIEYHDHLRGGTLDLLKQRLSPTHSVSVCQAGSSGYGMLYAAIRAQAGAETVSRH